ncbi:hypothetical protein BGT96_15975 [Clostridioides difficile]|uniref:hypothetical protein n=1 Tax=Clostridioides difficile TaxID=1496 RepID=UPI00038D03F0|nr:hypothetical protein [Clostridioides difficile]EJX3465469.1 hypothetical protein [Clostridioides difficile]EQJ94777.1 hypothetical protein QUA_0932 [Clostridioides difficile P49]MBY1861053.1 hypothetical protein [Clostridioides difficile]MBY2483430.1 hypothetical protein [Clostridioides difficile]MBZ0706780.1 hypothetical protein [Clostridioides difficile]
MKNLLLGTKMITQSRNFMLGINYKITKAINLFTLRVQGKLKKTIVKQKKILCDSNGAIEFTLQNILVGIIIIVAAGLLLKFIVGLLNDDMFPTFKSKILNMFSI